jgi:predicted amidohydrolase
MIIVATMQSDVCADVRENGRHIRSAMVQAARHGARLAHFPECALSGYVQEHVTSWSGVDWAALEEELQRTAELARQLGLWVVVGANHRLPSRRGQPKLWPQNCLFVISDTGIIAGRYAKRLCSNTELTYWYTPGVDPLAFDVDGVRFGCALCIEVVFPHLFTEYERLGVHCLLLSSFSKDPIHGVMARAHAATNGYWLSMSTPVACSQGLPTTLFGPDGGILAHCPPGVSTMTVQAIDPDDERYRVPVRMARPWRARARSGELHAARAVRYPHARPPLMRKG